MAWRVFPWDPAAKPGEPFSPSYVHPEQGSGRFDIAGKVVVYLAETAVHAVAEKLQRFRGQTIDRNDLIESGKTLALVECRVGKIKLADLCDPATLVKHDIRPDVLASRELRKTQAVAALLEEGFGAAVVVGVVRRLAHDRRIRRSDRVRQARTPRDRA
jgi:hypothetical protein